METTIIIIKPQTVPFQTQILTQLSAHGFTLLQVVPF